MVSAATRSHWLTRLRSPSGLGRATMLVVPMSSDQKIQMRRRSMLGTVLFVLGIMVAIASVATSSVWLVGAAVIVFVVGVVLLFQVGKSLS